MNSIPDRTAAMTAVGAEKIKTRQSRVNVGTDNKDHLLLRELTGQRTNAPAATAANKTLLTQ